MLEVDQLLSDEELVGQVYEAQGERHEKSRTREGVGKHQPRRCSGLLLLKHVRNWSYDVLEREVRANLVYPGLHAHWIGEGAGRQDAGADWASHRRRGGS